MKKAIVTAIGIGSVALGLAAVARAEAAPRRRAVRVQRISYHGWNDALRITNGVVEAVVVPQIGRIMAFQWAGKPQTNPLFLNPLWAGKTVADTNVTTWAAFGGDKVWPSPQGDWGKHHSRQWPPDQTFDGDPEIAQILPDGVRLTAPNSASFAVRSTRTITMKPGEPRLYIAQTFVKDPDAPAEREGFPMGIWSITQVRGDATAFMPLAVSAANPKGWWTMSDAKTAEAPPYWVAKDGVMQIRRDIAKPHKAGSDSRAGWLALLYGGPLLFSEHYTFPAGAPMVGNEHPVEVYTNNGTTPDKNYMEMELLGPMLPLKKGQKTSYNIYWQLGRVARTPRDTAQARAMVVKAMSVK